MTLHDIGPVEPEPLVRSRRRLRNGIGVVIAVVAFFAVVAVLQAVL